MNTSGIQPLDLRVLVKPDPIEEKTAGGIIIPDSTKDQKKYAQIKATVVAVGENAWEEAKARSREFVAPKPGDRVIIQKYGGIDMEGQDGALYRLLNDEDILGRYV